MNVYIPGVQWSVKYGSVLVSCIECLIVMCSKVTVKVKKGQSLAWQFEQTMESGDASDKEAPPCDPKRKDLMQKEQSKAISMLVAMETEDSLRRGAIMVVTQKFNLAYAEQKVHMSWV